MERSAKAWDLEQHRSAPDTLSLRQRVLAALQLLNQPVNFELFQLRGPL